MSEITLDTLIQILAALAGCRAENSEVLERNITKSFLQNQLSNELVEKKIVLFDDHYRKYINQIEQGAGYKNILDSAFKLAASVSTSLTYRQRIFILISLAEFAYFLKEYLLDQKSYQEYFELVNKIGEILNIKPEIISACIFFAKGDMHMIDKNAKLLTISEASYQISGDLSNLILKDFKGICYVLLIHRDFYLLRYEGKEIVYLDNKPISDRKTYFFSLTSSFRGKNTEIVYYHDLGKFFTNKKDLVQFDYVANDISYKFPKSTKGIQAFNLRCESGELIGILGSSGSGKTTLLRLLRSELPLKTGEILIGGKKEVDKKITGYIPQDDLLINELSVFENLYYSAKLSFKEINSEALEEKVNNLLESFGLFDIKDLKVGPLNKKIISGGERRRLNIALEIIRNPLILFADEPTSGLSSGDASRVIDYLRRYAQTSKLIFVNIHQPSDKVFYSFNKILIIDQGGHPVYFGKPGEALNYFRKTSKTIENVSLEKNITISENIFNILEETETDSIGNKSRVRKIAPQEWYEAFVSSSDKKKKTHSKELVLPTYSYSVPNLFQQLNVYLLRTAKSLWADNQFRILVFTIMPLLAVILSVLCREVSITPEGALLYNFYKNDNIASFLFLSVIATVFVGLIVSAEEIIKEKKIWIRERDISNSPLSYYGSKAIIFSVISLIQTFCYTVIAYFILKISGNILTFWLILFITTLLSNMIGLILSSFFQSIASIYIMIPIIMVPQILLSGVVVKYDKLNRIFNNERFVPLIGDLMPIRWGYEALVVNQFKNNEYQNYLFEIEEQRSRLNFESMILMPQLQSLVNQITVDINKVNQSQDLNKNTKLLINELNNSGISHKLNIQKSALKENVVELENISKHILTRKVIIARELTKLSVLKDKIIHDNGGDVFFQRLKQNNANRSIEKLVLNRSLQNPIARHKNTYVQKIDPIYKLPQSINGRAHYYASVKKLGNTYIDSIYFNILVLSLMIIFLFIILTKEFQFLKYM